MARNIFNAIKALTEKADRLAKITEQLQEENKDLKEENERLRREIAEYSEISKNHRLEVEYLTLSYKLANSPQKLADSRRLVARLIRILDKCIELLKEDPKL